MQICHEHNTTHALNVARPFGIRVRIKPGDSFARVLGADWEALHWFESAQRRDRALADMASEHLYSRRGDAPTLIFEAIEPAKKSK